MFNAPWTTLATAFLLLSTGPADAQQPGAANLERVEVAGKKAEVSKWFRAESQHFVMYSDAREEDVTALLDNLEKLDHLLRIYTLPMRRDEALQPKLTLYHHARPGDLRAVADNAPADVLGLYSSCAAGVRGFGVQLERIPSLADEQLEKAGLNDTLSHAFEAYARHFLYRHTDIRSPQSFIDGFAQYFSSVRFSQGQMVVGRIPVSIARYLNFLDSGRRYGLEWEDVLLNRLAGARSYGGSAGVRLEFEARSWLLTHYMLSSEDNRQRLDRYLVLVGRGLAPTTAFERAFEHKLADLGRLLHRYSRRVGVLRVAPESLPSARVSLRSLPRAAGEFRLADAALRACPGRPAGEALLRWLTTLAAGAPAELQGRLSLGRAEIEWGDPRRALEPLAAVLRDDEGHFEARYLLGLAQLRLAEASAGAERHERLQAAQSQLRQALAASPRSAEAALALFRAVVAGQQPPDEAVLQGVISAWQDAREVDALARAAVLAHAYAGRADQAHQALEPLARNGHDAAQTQWALQWRRRLETGVSRGDILAAMRQEPAAGAPFREWTLDKASAMRAVELGHGLEAAESFIKAHQRQEGEGRNPTMPTDRPGR